MMSTRMPVAYDTDEWFQLWDKRNEERYPAAPQSKPASDPLYDGSYTLDMMRIRNEAMREYGMGTPFSENPYAYKGERILYSVWSRGWRDAQKEAQAPKAVLPIRTERRMNLKRRLQSTAK